MMYIMKIKYYSSSYVTCIITFQFDQNFILFYLFYNLTITMGEGEFEP